MENKSLSKWQLLKWSNVERATYTIKYLGDIKTDTYRWELLSKIGRKNVTRSKSTPVNTWDYWDLYFGFMFCLSVQGLKISDYFSLLVSVWDEVRICNRKSLGEVAPLLLVHHFRLKGWGKYRYSVNELSILAQKIFGVPITENDIINCFHRNKIPLKESGKVFLFPARKKLFFFFEAYLQCLEEESL